MRNKNLKIFLVLASIVVFLFACITSVLTINYYNQKMQCLYNGALYQSGESFMSIDACNTCTCSGGTVSCTEMACNVNNTDNTSTNSYMKGVEVYCYQSNGQTVYSILPGTNRLKTYQEVTMQSDFAISSPVASFTNKTKLEATQILLENLNFSFEEGESMLLNCTPAESLQ